MLIENDKNLERKRNIYRFFILYILSFSRIRSLPHILLST